ncbi:MAG: hypothetical protein M1834_006519 [Cirrosporium novae-zelandiae]|nr:MAG: hypothetical protein M1834_006519 [Cirrosporium novae-zelandiae]
MIRSHDDFLNEISTLSKEALIAFKKSKKQLQFQISTLYGLQLRSNSNKERLLNEINLAFNTVAQYDSRTSVRIGQEVQLDSATMKTIATLNLMFLPATFVSH